MAESWNGGAKNNQQKGQDYVGSIVTDRRGRIMEQGGIVIDSKGRIME